MIETPAPTSRLLTIAETMAILGCSRKTVYRLFDDGKLRRVYVPSRTGRTEVPRVPCGEVEAFLAYRGIAS